jgi:glyoxylase-like metal-dependent hydrolase (beta-lactamase superfamily II)
MSLQVTTFVNGRWRENCYLIADQQGDLLLVDPGGDAAGIAKLIDENGWRPRAIINTHGHFDHIGAVADLMERYEMPFYMHRADDALLRRANLFRQVFESPDWVRIPIVTHDISKLPSVFQAGPFDISWMPTPGHTEGSVCFVIGAMLFSGDTLMHKTIGRTDLPGGNRERLLASVRELQNLAADTVIWGGHGPSTTVGAEFSDGSRVRSLIA